MINCISLVWLAAADLSNLNSGQGSGNLTELKTYDNGRKPYVSGQANRRALFDTIAKMYPEEFKCTAERPCADVEKCWGCDLRGFLATKEEVGGDRRWSPLKMTPALGQIPGEVVTDLLIRMSDIEKNDRKSKDQRIAHVQMMRNTYRIGMVIDVQNVGRVLKPRFEGTGKEQRVAGWEEVVNVGDEERRRRITAVLDGVFNLSGYAKQARAAASLAPDVVIISMQTTYNQRGVKALEMDDDGNVDVNQLQYILDEHQALGNRVLFGYSPGVVENEDDLLNVVRGAGVKVNSVIGAFEDAKDCIG